MRRIMGKYFDKKANKDGFTIVELIIITIVIGIIAAISYASYTGLNQRASRSALQTDLKVAANLMAQERLKSTTREYPSTFPSELKVSQKTTLVLTVTPNGSTFCINGTADGLNEAWKFDSTNGLASGTCSGAIISSTETKGSAVVTKTNFIADKTFSSGGWSFPKQSGTSTLSTRSGTTSDPISDKPVLVIQNDAGSTSWSFVRGTLTNPTALQATQRYTVSIWARVASGSTIRSNTPAVMDNSATNRVIDMGSAVTLNSSWQKLTTIKNAAINGLNSSVFYLWINNSDINQTATIELQDAHVE